MSDAEGAELVAGLVPLIKEFLRAWPWPRRDIFFSWRIFRVKSSICLLYTSDAADERSSVDLGGRRIIKKKKKRKQIDSEDMEDRNNMKSTVATVHI